MTDCANKYTIRWVKSWERALKSCTSDMHVGKV